MTQYYSDSDSPIPLLLRRMANLLGKPFGINPFPRAFHYQQLQSNPQQAFDTIYHHNLWGSAQSRSGVGSELAFTRNYRKALSALLQRRGVRSLFDAPCGDLNWMPALLEETAIHYQGGDISPALVQELAARHPALSIKQFDICSHRFPQADVWHCRDCLFHLPFAQIRKALHNFVQSEIPFALLTTHRAFLLHQNLDVRGVGFRFLDLERAPISLPKPLVYLPDYRKGVDFPRYVGLWRREDIAQALQHWSEPCA